MKSRNVIFIAFAVHCSASIALSAELIQSVDPRYPTPLVGGFNVTSDRETGLDWLTPLVSPKASYNQMQALLQTTYAGYRYATVSELGVFLGHTGFNVSEYPETAEFWPSSGNAYFNSAKYFDNRPNSFGVLGIVESGASDGKIYSSGVTYEIIQPTVNSSETYHIMVYGTGSQMPPDFVTNRHWLVRATPVPEPTTLALAGFGGIALLAHSIRRRLSTRRYSGLPGR